MVNTSVCHSLQKRRFLNPSQPSPQLCPGISLVFPPSPSSPSLQLHDITSFVHSTGFRWSYVGAIRGMRCTRVIEPADSNAWTDNYLCVPSSSNYRFTWAYGQSMRPGGQSCIQWLEPGDRGDTWTDNYLCGNTGAGPTY